MTSAGCGRDRRLAHFQLGVTAAGAIPTQAATETDVEVASYNGGSDSIV
jgi:hypothetical protein